ncbi:MAG: hypothetical protein ACPGN3_11735 [Opitutales bacterium]
METLFNPDTIAILAQLTSLTDAVQQAMETFKLIIGMLVIGVIIYAGILFSQGQIAQAAYCFFGAIVIATSFLVASSLMEATGSDLPPLG